LDNTLSNLQKGGNMKDEALRAWAKEMVEWGKRVRNDILRLENVTGLTEGDPGEPPGPPPNGD
jgi:hypothetical protein